MPAKAFVVNGEVQIVSCKTGRKVCMSPLGVRENSTDIIVETYISICKDLGISEIRSLRNGSLRKVWLIVGACDMDHIASLSNEITLACGSLALRMNKMSLTLELVSRVLEKNPSDKAALMLLAKTHLLKNEYSDVIGLLQAVDKDRKLWEVFSLACYKLTRFDLAVEAIGHCEEEDDKHDEDINLGVRHLECRILLLADAKKYPLEATVQKFERTLKLTQRSKRPSIHLEALFTRAQLFEKNNQWGKCCNDLQDSIDILQSPDAVNHFHVKDFIFKATFAYIYKVFLSWKMHADTQLIDQLFRDSMKFAHTTRTLQSVNLAQFIYKMLSHQEIDLQGFMNEVASYTDDLRPFACYIVARALIESDLQGNDAKAFEYLQLSLTLNKNKPHVWISMGSMFLRSKRIPDALSAYSKALELVHSTKETHNFLSKHLLPGLNENVKSFAYFGTAQAYMMSNDIDNASVALRQCLNSLSGDDKDAMEKSGLEDLINVLNISMSVDLEKLKESLTIPEIPLSLFLNPMFYLQESQVFQIKETVLETSRTTLKSMPLAIPPTTTESTPKNNPNFKKKIMKKPHETVKPSKLRRRKRNDIFRRANLSISKNKHITNHPKKKQSHHPENDNHTPNTPASNNHTHSYDHPILHNRDSSNRINETNSNSNHQDSQINNNTTGIEHINIQSFPSIPSSTIYDSNFIPQYGSLYVNNEQSHLTRAAPFNHTNITASNTPSIYPHPAQVIHYFQPVDFPASPSFYYPQPSLEEAYRNNSNGMDPHSPPQTYGRPVMMPQYSNSFYPSDQPRFSASLPTRTAPFMTQQPLQQQRPFLPADRSNCDSTSGDSSQIASFIN